MDSAGNLYLTNQPLSQIWKVTPAGLVTVYTGNGFPGSSSDGGQAVSAEIRYPQGIAFDAANNLYIADLGSRRVRKVTPQGIISTVAGTGTLGSSGDGGQAVNANLRYPIAVSVDSLNNLYILEFQNAL